MRFISVFYAATLLAGGAHAQSLTEDRINAITTIANTFCISLENSGAESSVSVGGAAEAEARALLGLIGGAEGEIDVDAFVSRYKNVPRSELADMMRTAQACRLRIYDDLRDVIVTSVVGSSPQKNTLAWDFPHVEVSGLALGVINVRDGGSGVDINYRLRNTSNEPVYVKAGSMSYTDSNGNVCAKGSLSTWISGDISWRDSHDLTLLNPGQSIQYAGVNIRCDSGEHSNTGDIIASVGKSSTPDKNNLDWISFEIARVKTLQ